MKHLQELCRKSSACRLWLHLRVSTIPSLLKCGLHASFSLHNLPNKNCSTLSCHLSNWFGKPPFFLLVQYLFSIFQPTNAMENILPLVMPLFPHPLDQQVIHSLSPVKRGMGSQMMRAQWGAVYKYFWCVMQMEVFMMTIPFPYACVSIIVWITYWLDVRFGQYPSMFLMSSCPACYTDRGVASSICICFGRLFYLCPQYINVFSRYYPLEFGLGGLSFFAIFLSCLEANCIIC